MINFSDLFEYGITLMHFNCMLSMYHKCSNPDAIGGYEVPGTTGCLRTRETLQLLFLTRIIKGAAIGRGSFSWSLT